MKDKKTIFILLLLTILILLFCLFAYMASAISIDLNWTWDQKLEVCNVLNVSIPDCVTGWEHVTDGNFTQVITINDTVYVNNTIYVNVTEEINSTDKDLIWQQAEWDHEYRMAQLENQEGDNPVESSLSMEEIRAEISNAISSSNPPQVLRNNDSSYYWYIAIGVVLLAGFFVYKKFSSSRSPPPDYSVDPAPSDSAFYKPLPKLPGYPYPTPQQVVSTQHSSTSAVGATSKGGLDGKEQQSE